MIVTAAIAEQEAAIADAIDATSFAIRISHKGLT